MYDFDETIFIDLNCGIPIQLGDGTGLDKRSIKI